MAVDLDPVEGVLAVLDDGAATGTNKFALLLALIDLATSVAADRVLEVRDIADKLLELHWDHARDYDGTVLRQVTSGNRENTTAMLEVQRLRDLLIFTGVGNPSFEAARALLERTEWDRSLDTLARATVRNPLRFLQTINRQQVPFLYEQLDGRAIRFLPGAVEALVRFGPVLRDLVEFRYVRFVVAANYVRIGPSLEQQVAEHLFGLDRHMPPVAMRHELWVLQGKRCVYTNAFVDDPTKSRSNASLDHVVPWSRTRVSAIENFVLTSRSVNSTKSNLLLAPPLVQRWSVQVLRHGDELRTIATRYGWVTDVARVARVAASIYRRVPLATAVWAGPGEVDTLGQNGKDTAIAAFEHVAASAPGPT